MNKWRLLLLSVLGLLQSASTEQNFVDGRNRYRWSDIRFSSHEPYRLIVHRQADIPNEQSNLVRHAELTTPALRNIRERYVRNIRTDLRWRLQDKYGDTDYVTRFRVRNQNDRYLNRQRTYKFNKAFSVDADSHRIIRDFTDHQNIGSISSFRNNDYKKEDIPFRFHGAEERRNYDDMLSRNKCNSRDAIINNIRIRMYDGNTNFLNRDGYVHDGSRRVFRERDFLVRGSKGISLYKEPEVRRQTQNFDRNNNSNNVYRSFSENMQRRNTMNHNSQEKDIFGYNFFRNYARSHNYMRNKHLAGKATLSDESCTANTRKSEIEKIKDVRDSNRKNYARRTVISDISVRDGSRFFYPEEWNSKILNTRTANIILRGDIKTDIPKFRSRNLSIQIRTLDEDLYNRNIQERSPTVRRNSFIRDIYSRNVFSAEDIQRNTLRRSHRLSIRKRQSNKLPNISQMQNVNIKNMQRNNKNANQMKNVRNIHEGLILNIHLNNTEQHSVQKQFVSENIGNRNSRKVRSLNLSTQEARTYTNKSVCTSNVQDEKVLNDRSTETSKIARRERSRSVSFRGVTNKIENIRNKQEMRGNVHRVALIRERQNLMPKLHVSKITEENIEDINQDRSTLLSTGESARYMLHINPVSRKQLIVTRGGNASENRNIQDRRYRALLSEEKVRNIIQYNRNTLSKPLQRSQSRISSERQYVISELPERSTRYIKVGHQDRSRSLTIEKRVSDEITRTGDIREERFLRKRSITSLKRETPLIHDIERNRHRSAINGKPSTNEIRQTQNIRKYQSFGLVTFSRSEKQNSVNKRHQIPTNGELTQFGRERITDKIRINRYVENTRISNERREIISSRQHSNPTVVFLVKPKESTNEYRLYEFRSLSAEKRITTNQIINIRHVREERLQDIRYISPINREKRVMLSRQRERITNELEKTRYVYSERRQNKLVSSNEGGHFANKLSIRRLERSDNRQDKLRTSFTRERITDEVQPGYYKEERLPNIENIPKLYANDRLIDKTDRNYNRHRILSREDNLERGIPITRHTKENRFLPKERITSLARDLVLDKGLQVNLYQSTIHRTNEYMTRDTTTDTRRISLTRKRQCTSLQCSMSTSSVMKDTQIENIFEIKWQFIFYLLQGLYLWNLFIKKPKANGESKYNLRFPQWFAAMDYMKIH